MRIICFLFFTLSLSAVYGQHGTDSISALVSRAANVQEKVSILNETAAALVNADLKKSFDYASQAYELAAKSKDEIGTAYALLNLGKYYSRLGQHDTAMKKCMLALEISERVSNEKLKGTVLKIIGNNYFFKGDLDMALEYYERALAVNIKVDDLETAADLQNNIALVFINENKLDSALDYLIKSVETYSKLKKATKLSNALLNIGLAKDKAGLHEEAIDYFKQALEINRANGRSLQEGVALNNIGNSLIQLKQFRQAEPYVMDALVIGERENFRTLLLNVYDNLYTLAKQKNDLAAALTYHEKWMTLKDNVANEQQTKQIEELRINYEAAQKEREFQSLLLETSLQEQQLTDTRILLFFIGLLAITGGGLAFSYYKSLVQNRKAKEELITMNQRIHEQKEEIVEAARRLSRANDEIAHMNQNLQTLVEEKTSKILEQNARLIEYTAHNSHRVRGPLTRILGLINLVKLDSVEEGEMDYILEEIENSSVELDSVIKEINHSLNSTIENLGGEEARR